MDTAAILSALDEISDALDLTDIGIENREAEAAAEALEEARRWLGGVRMLICKSVSLSVTPTADPAKRN